MDKKLKEYAALLIELGVNLQQGETLAIACPVECCDLAEEAARAAYERGAERVVMFWSSGKLSKLSYQYQSEKTLTEVPDYLVASRDFILGKKGAYLCIISDEPGLYEGLDAKKIAAASRATGKALIRFRESTSKNETRWCLAAYPNPAWAKKMFPSLPEKEALEKQWEYLHKTMRMDEGDPIARWRAHQEKLVARSKILNEKKIKSLHYVNALGTDFTVGMTDRYLFTGAVETGADGIAFTANMPTEEVFSSPDRRTANGKLVAAMPLVRNGVVIEHFSMTFRDGRIVDFSAEKGYDTLKEIISTDEGSHYLGEIALVGYHSPIRALNTLFYSTLFDENASCHFAIGRGFPACYRGGEKMTKEALLERGVNDSLEHVDFMVGTPDLSITATTEGGEEFAVFRDGDWAF